MAYKLDNQAPVKSGVNLFKTQTHPVLMCKLMNCQNHIFTVNVHNPDSEKDNNDGVKLINVLQE